LIWFLIILWRPLQILEILITQFPPSVYFCPLMSKYFPQRPVPSATPSIYILHSRCETKFHTHTKGQYRSLAYSRSALSWDITQRWVLVLYRRFGTTYLYHIQGSRRLLGLLDPWRLDRYVVPKRRYKTTTNAAKYPKRAQIPSTSRRKPEVTHCIF
jgi:hypothetical protein